MKNFKKVLSFVMATVLCLSLNITAFASEPDSSIETSLVSESEAPEIFIISADGTTRSASISGYGQAILKSNDTGFLVKCSANGIGGMGITIETSCSRTFEVNYIGGVAQSYSPLTSKIDGKMSSNGHVEHHNLWQTGNFAYYMIAFGGIPDGVEMHVTVWIYG